MPPKVTPRSTTAMKSRLIIVIKPLMGRAPGYRVPPNEFLSASCRFLILNSRSLYRDWTFLPMHRSSSGPRQGAGPSLHRQVQTLAQTQPRSIVSLNHKTSIPAGPRLDPRLSGPAKSANLPMTESSALPPVYKTGLPARSSVIA